MKAVFSFPVDQYSGRDGAQSGLVYMKLNGINVARKFVTPSNPKTAQQVLARGQLTGAAQAFKLLTPAQRAAWAAYAAIDRRMVLGKLTTLQDLPMYASIAIPASLQEMAWITAAPTALPGFQAASIGSVAYATATTTLSFNITHNGTAAVGYWLVYATPALASAQRMARPSDFRLVCGVDPESMPAVVATGQAFTTNAPLASWLDDDWMEIQLVPIGADYGRGKPIRFRQQITVT